MWFCMRAAHAEMPAGGARNVCVLVMHECLLGLKSIWLCMRAAYACMLLAGDKEACGLVCVLVMQKCLLVGLRSMWFGMRAGHA